MIHGREVPRPGAMSTICHAKWPPIDFIVFCVSQLTIDVEIMHPPALVWRVLTEAKLLNEWFQPIAGWPESGAGAGARGKVYPTDEMQGFTSFDVEVVACDAPRRLNVQWIGEDFFSEITCEIEPTALGSRVIARQSGFLGTELAARRETLHHAYEIMIERFAAVIDRLAAGVGEANFLLATDPPAAPPKGPLNRTRLLSLLGALVLAVLCGSAGAVWLNREPTAPAGQGADRYGMSSGSQPGATSKATSPGTLPAATRPGQATVAPTTGPPAPSPGAPAPGRLGASYRTIALLGLLGFDTEVTVTNPSGNAHTSGWTVVLTMPDATKVENRNPAVVTLKQEGATITLTPVKADLAAGAGVTFVVRFPALLALGQSAKSCTIDGRSCASS